MDNYTWDIMKEWMAKIEAKQDWIIQRLGGMNEQQPEQESQENETQPATE